MDRNNLIAILLIGSIIIGYSLWMSSNQETKPDNLKNFNERVDSLSEEDKSAEKIIPNEIELTDSISMANKFGKFFTPFATGQERVITIETDFYTAKISSKGAAISKWELKNYNQWHGKNSQLIWENDKQVFLNFLSQDGKRIDTRDLFFDMSKLKKDYYKISGEKKLSFAASLDFEEGKSLTKNFVFYGDKYHFETDVKLQNLDNILPKRGYNFSWVNGLKYQEYNTIDESNGALALASFNGEAREIDATDDVEIKDAVKGTTFDYAGIKNKYFAVAFKTDMKNGTVDLYGSKELTSNEGVIEHYDMQIRVPYEGGTQTNSFLVFIGPLESDLVESYGFGSLVDYGWWIFRYIGMAIFQILSLLQSFIPNWGITIMIFSIFLKVLLYPLSAPQMRASQKMKLLAPQIAKIREKNKDDMQKQQKETMSLYSDYGVNPMGGCLPMLLQMPILYTLWTVFRSNINLRQADFAFWIHDLSIPDTIVDFGFSMMGLKSISGLALAMGVTMFVQQKLTITDPRQKSLVYMMPIMFTLMFSSFPSGLNLYYFMFNLIGIGQQIYINKFSKATLSLEQMKQSPKKESWMQKKMAQAQEMAEMQQKAKSGGSTMNKYINEQKKKKK